MSLAVSQRRRLTYLTGARLDTVGQRTGSFSPHSWTVWAIHFHPFEAKTCQPPDRGEHQYLWHGLMRDDSFTLNWWNTLDLLNGHKGCVNSLGKVKTCFGQSPTDACRASDRIIRQKTNEEAKPKLNKDFRDFWRRWYSAWKGVRSLLCVTGLKHP